MNKEIWYEKEIERLKRELQQYRRQRQFVETGGDELERGYY